MAIALTNHGFDTSGSDFSFTTSGTNRILWNFVVADTTDTVTGSTYGGVAMTLVDKVQRSVADRWLYSFYLVAPASGSNTISIALSAGSWVESFVLNFSGALQSGQPDAHGTNTVIAGTSLSKSITTTANNCWTVGMMSLAAARVLTPDAGTNVVDTDGSNISRSLDSNANITPPGSTSLGGSWAVNASGGILVASIAPLPASGGMFMIL